MFNRHSVFFTLSIGFFISITLVVISFITLLKHEEQELRHLAQKKYFPITRLINTEYLRYGITQNLQNAIRDMGFSFINDSKKIDEILTNKNIQFIYEKENKLNIIIVFTDNEINYIYYQTPFDEFIIVDKNINHETQKEIIEFIFILILITLIIVAYLSYKKLMPLNHLKNEIKSLYKSKDKIDISFIKTNAKDEVALLAHEFENTLNRLNQFKESRNIFIRNIMHELKTPITKGKFLMELPKDEENKELLKNVFFRLESLIEEFASIEEIIVKEDNIIKKTYLLDDIIDNAIDLLYLDEDKVSFDTKEFKININFKLFSIAIKNLIDNGIKYSNNHKIKIEVKESKILFISSGDKLTKPLNEYLQPFNQDQKTLKDNFQETTGFGLGLYIVENILNAHKMHLEYEYLDNKNIFIIKV